MGIESLLGPLKALNEGRRWVDEQVHIQYSKLAEQYVDGGKSRILAAAILNLSSAALYVASYKFGSPELRTVSIASYPLWGVGWTCNAGTTFYHGIFDRLQLEGLSVEMPPRTRQATRMQEWLRLPLFVSGSVFLGKGLYDVFSYAWSGFPECLHEVCFDLSLGYGLFGLASSMYLQDSDPAPPRREFSLRWLMNAWLERCGSLRGACDGEMGASALAYRDAR